MGEGVWGERDKMEEMKEKGGGGGDNRKGARNDEQVEICNK
jgi:hypothetical protein